MRILVETYDYDVILMIWSEVCLQDNFKGHNGSKANESYIFSIGIDDIDYIAVKIYVLGWCSRFTEAIECSIAQQLFNKFWGD